MSKRSIAPGTLSQRHAGWWLLLAAMIVTIVVYSSGLTGTYLFDDYPNIVDNHAVQPQDASVPSLVRAALSSPSSEFKRPLASLSFAANYLATGLDPYWMKLTNLIIHLLNGLLVFLLSRRLLLADGSRRTPPPASNDRAPPVGATSVAMPFHPDQTNATENPTKSIAAEAAATRAPNATAKRIGVIAALITASWMLLPINLTGLLYVVQRMESMANLFVLLGLIGYVAGRQRMLAQTPASSPAPHSLPSVAGRRGLTWGGSSPSTRGFVLCITSITMPTAVGMLAKETAVMLPLYAVLVEWILFRFAEQAALTQRCDAPARLDRRIITMFILVLALPMILGLTWLVPGLLRPETWATRDFTMGTRLLSEARIVTDYIVWTLLPTPNALSFYHDDFRISTGLLAPWTTLACIVFLGALIGLMLWLRRRHPLAALGIALFLGCQLLTGTIIPLELIYEHRNYFASFGLLLAIVPLLAAPRPIFVGAHPVRESSSATRGQASSRTGCAPTKTAIDGLPMALPRYTLLAGLMLFWALLTAITAHAWGNPLRLAEDLAARAPQSPRAQYELGRTYVIYSHYDPTSPFTALAYGPLERAAVLPDASILPEQALIFMNSRMHLPLKDAWWNSLAAKLSARKATIQDESSLGALTQCDIEERCDLPPNRMMAAFMAALSHPNPSARLLATYGDYAWNVLNDRALGLTMTGEAVNAQPSEPAYRITQIRMLSALGQTIAARAALTRLEALNIAGSLNKVLAELRNLPGLQ